MLQRLNLMGEKDENNIQVYQSEKFTAQLETANSGTYIFETYEGKTTLIKHPLPNSDVTSIEP
jgi:hypothetical protein